MDDEIAESYLLDSILTLVDAKHAEAQLDTRQEARRQIGFADQIFISKTDLVDDASVEALIHRIKHMNPRAPQHRVHFGEVPLADVFDLKGFNLNAKLDIDPDFLKADDDHDHHDHDTTTTSTASTATIRTTMCTTTTSSLSSSARTARSTPPSSRTSSAPIVQVYGPKMLRYKGVLFMKGTDRKVIFQGVHQLMGSDVGPKWAPGEKKNTQDGLHRAGPAARRVPARPGAVPGLSRRAASPARSRPLRNRPEMAAPDAGLRRYNPRRRETAVSRRSLVVRGPQTAVPGGSLRKIMAQKAIKKTPAASKKAVAKKAAKPGRQEPVDQERLQEGSPNRLRRPPSRLRSRPPSPPQRAS